MIDTLFVYYTHKPGGMCARLYRAIRACAERGDRVAYLSLDVPPVDLGASVELVRIPFALGRRSGLLFWGLYTLWLPIFILYFSMRDRPKRFVVFGAYYANACRLAAWWTGSPVILLLRSLTFRIDELTGKPEWLRKITGLVDRSGIRAAATVIAMSQHMRSEAEAFSGRSLGHFPVLCNDLPVLSEPNRITELGQPFEAVTVGVLDARKNISVLLRAFQKLEHEGSHWSLRILGDGPDRKKLEAEAAELGLQRVTFCGWVSDAIPHIRKASVLLHPSLHEGVPNAVLEALSVGRMVLLSEIPEHRELVASKDGAVVLLPVNNPTEWALALQRLASDEEASAALTAASIGIADRLRFNWDETLFKVTRC